MRLVVFFRRFSGLGCIYNLHFRAFQTVSFRAKKKLEMNRIFFEKFPSDLKKCELNCTRLRRHLNKSEAWIAIYWTRIYNMQNVFVNLGTVMFRSLRKSFGWFLSSVRQRLGSFVERRRPFSRRLTDAQVQKRA